MRGNEVACGHFQRMTFLTIYRQKLPKSAKRLLSLKTDCRPIIESYFARGDTTVSTMIQRIQKPCSVANTPVGVAVVYQQILVLQQHRLVLRINILGQDGIAVVLIY